MLVVESTGQGSETEVRAFTPSSVQGQQDAAEEREATTTKSAFTGRWQSRRGASCTCMIAHKKTNVSFEMVNPWKEIHFICQDGVHSSSFLQWASTLIRTQHWRVKGESTEWTCMTKTQTRDGGHTLGGWQAAAIQATLWIGLSPFGMSWRNTLSMR